MDECRFCLEGRSDYNNPLIRPCKCRGSIAYVHKICLQTWQRTINQATKCPICLSYYLFVNGLEEIPDYRDISKLLNVPFMVFIINYFFLWYIAYLPLEKKTFDLCVWYISSFSKCYFNSPVWVITYSNVLRYYMIVHLALSALYICTYISYVAQLRNIKRYLWYVWPNYTLLIICDFTLIISFPALGSIAGVAHHILLPYYFREHERILKVMNDRREL